MIVVDSMRFPYIDGTGTFTTTSPHRRSAKRAVPLTMRSAQPRD